MNVLAVLLVMVAIYGYYAIFDPRAAREDLGRGFSIGGWAVVSAGALAWLAYKVGPSHLADTQHLDLATFLYVLMPYGAIMTLTLQTARIVALTTPAVLVTHGMAFAAIGDSHIAFLFALAIAMTPVVLYAALRRKVGNIVRVIAYVWCMLVFTVYTVRFVDQALVQTTAIGTTLLALPFLLVRLSSFAAVLLMVMPSQSDGVGTYLEDSEMLLARAQIERMPVAVALGLPIAAAVVMGAALKLDQAGLAFVVLYVAGQELGHQLQPPAYPAPRWWQSFGL